MIFPPWWDSVMRKVFGPALSVVSLPIALNGADREMTMVLCCAFRAQDQFTAVFARRNTYLLEGMATVETLQSEDCDFCVVAFSVGGGCGDLKGTLLSTW